MLVSNHLNELVSYQRAIRVDMLLSRWVWKWVNKSRYRYFQVKGHVIKLDVDAIHSKQIMPLTFDTVSIEVDNWMFRHWRG